MTKLIGNNPNQVPSNADLGTAAFMDKKDFLLSKGSSLSAIDAVITKTAVDVLIYDTSKDSDGGAWRKRTQHTSWYNERLNTTTRGSRREFPNVAVIVLANGTGGGLYIYDGDDPGLPLWMHFENSGTSWNSSILPLASGNNYLTSVSTKNGYIFIGSTNNAIGLMAISFIEDMTRSYLNANYGGIDTSPLVNRNTSGHTFAAGAGTGNNTLPPLVSIYINDLAVTVLPNAPIDYATGLPIPTIAVATDGGVSVIKDDGTAVDITVNNASYTYARRVNFLSDNSLGMGIGVSNGVAQESYYIFNNIPTSDNVITVDNIAGTTQNVDEFYAIQHPNTLVDLQILGLDTNRALSSSTGNSFGADKGLSVISRNVVAPDKGIVAYIASDYNTGWHVGNTKLATLSDTDAAYIKDTNFVTNGNMSTSDTSSFLPYNSGSLQATVSITGGELKLTHTGTTNYAFARVIFDAEIGQVYTVKGRLKNGNASYAQVKPHSGCTFNPSEKVHSGTSYEDFHFTVTATSTSVQFRLQLVGSNGQYAYFDDVVAKVAEADRTLINNNALEVFGTVTKTPVAAGADLVAYSGFSTNNYLSQPPNTDLDFGTGDFCAMGWFKSNTGTGGNENLFFRGQTDTNGYAMIEPYIRADGRVDVLTRNAAEGTSIFTTTNSVLTQQWLQWCMVRSSGVMYFYINGVVDGSQANTRDLTPSTSAKKTFRIGNSWNGLKPLPGSAALFRISATAPTAEQIAKIYEDEKVLFQENAKATLYGTSDPVTALAYDDDTDLLHVGTSAGRSVFQGLRRIDNTTRAVGTAISAVDGFVVEE